MTQNSNPTILIVDNLSPFTKDIVNSVSELGVRYTLKRYHSLANATFSNEHTKFNSETQNSHSNEGGYGHPGNGQVVDKPKKILGIGLNGNDSRIRSSGIDHAGDRRDNGKLFIDKVILSGRRVNDPKINAINSQIIKQCLRGGIPLLGICYGAEILALTLGGTIKRMPRAVQENVPITVSISSPLISKDAKPIFYESHKYSISRLPEGFESLASSIYCEHEIFCFKTLFGTQFHPEKSGSDGFNLLSNFIRM